MASSGSSSTSSSLGSLACFSEFQLIGARVNLRFNPKFTPAPFLQLLLADVSFDVIDYALNQIDNHDVTTSGLERGQMPTCTINCAHFAWALNQYLIEYLLQLFRNEKKLL
jgi:hypothetical protein